MDEKIVGGDRGVVSSVMIEKVTYKTYIINLDSRPDRWERISRLMCDLSGTCSLERFPAIVPDLTTIPVSYYRRFTLSKALIKNQSQATRYCQGATGCKMSHYEIIRQASREGLPYVLILEDDACLAPALDSIEFQTKLAMAVTELERDIKTWWMCYLGGKNVGQGRMITRHIGRIEGVKTTHAYLIHQRCYDRVLSGLLECGLEIDVFYQSLHRQIPCYRIVPGLLVQMEDYSDILGRTVKYEKVV